MATKGKGKDKGKASTKGKGAEKAKDRRKGKKPAKDKALDAAAKAAKAKAEKAGDAATMTSWTDALRIGPDFSLAALDAESTPGFSGDKAAGQLALEGIDEKLAELQERLYAESKGEGKRSLLLVVQGMDTSGKGGIMRYVVGAFDPQGVKHTAFKAPTAEERAHPFLWRITNALPGPGEIGVFDRSQYEDVLIVRVHDLVPRAQWARRYAQINAFEKRAAAAGITIVNRVIIPHQQAGVPRVVRLRRREDSAS